MNKQTSDAATQAWLDFAELAKFLLTDNSPLNINETPETSKFYKPAKDLAEELELDWDNLTQDESNRVMINLLSDYFMEIRRDDTCEYILEISVKEDKKRKLKQKQDESAENQS